jgi:hypothetical protein
LHNIQGQRSTRDGNNKDASGTFLPLIDLTPAVTVKVCDDGNATVKGESKTRPKGFAPRGGKR